MKELKCLKNDYKKAILRSFLDFIIIFILLFLIAFMGSFIKDFGSSFVIIFTQKLPLFFIMLAISILLVLLLAYIDIASRCLILRYDEEKVTFVKKKNEENMRLNYELYVRAELKKNSFFFSFRQNKRVVNAYLSIADGYLLLEHLKEKQIKLDLIPKDTGKIKESEENQANENNDVDNTSLK